MNRRYAAALGAMLATSTAVTLAEALPVERVPRPGRRHPESSDVTERESPALHGRAQLRTPAPGQWREAASRGSSRRRGRSSARATAGTGSVGAGSGADNVRSSPPSSTGGARPPSSSVPSKLGAPRYLLERVVVRGNRRTRTDVVLRYVNVSPGDVIEADSDALAQVRYRLLGVGYFRDVHLSLEKGSRRGRVALVIHVVERNTIIVNDLFLGLSADADTQGNARPLTAYAGLDVAETNLLGTGITLGSGVGFAQDQLALRVRFLDPAVFGSRLLSAGTLLYNSGRDFFGNDAVLYDDRSIEGVPRFAVVRYQRFGGVLGIGKDLGLTTQAWLHYRFEGVDASVPIAASHLRGNQREPLRFHIEPDRSLISTVQASLRFDTRDQPLLPTRGSLARVSGELALPPLGSSYAYQRFEASLARWLPLPGDHTLQLSFFVGAITGDAPFFDRYYVGDFSDFVSSRVLGLNFDRRPPPNFLGTAVGEVRRGRYAARLAAEYRVPLYRGTRSIYGIDVYLSAGLWALASELELERPISRYSGLARVPLDITGNFGLRMDTSLGGFTLALSNIVGFVPLRREPGE